MTDTSQSHTPDPRSASCSSHLAQASSHALEHAARSLVEGETDVSLLTFATGIELAVKARVALEHWLLLVKDPSKGPKGKFSLWDALNKGESQTIGASEALRLLGNACRDAERDALAAAHPQFSKVADERNRSVHFGIALGDTEKRGYLAALQISAYRSLKELAAHWPDSLFTQEDWEQLDGFFEQVEPFIEELEELIRPILREQHQAGKLEVGMCPACDCVSLAARPSDGSNPVVARCRVCQASSIAARGECPRESCQHTVLAPIVDGKRTLSVACPTCNHSSEAHSHGDVSTYGYWNLAPGEVDETIEPTCSECGWSDSTITSFEVDGDICFHCDGCEWTYRMSSHSVSSCDWCSEWWLGANLEESSATGCDSCGGGIGHAMEKAWRD